MWFLNWRFRSFLEKYDVMVGPRNGGMFALNLLRSLADRLGTAFYFVNAFLGLCHPKLFLTI